LSLKLEDVQHTYSAKDLDVQDRQVLSIESWHVQDGEHVLVRGVSGSGKTTMLNIIAGLMRPKQGSVTIGDQSIYMLGEEKRDRFRSRNIGYVFQNHYLISSLTAQQNVVMPMAFADATASTQWRSEANELLKKVGLADHIKHRPHQLSTGQRLRVAIARALANKPQVLLADEPTASLDGKMAMQVMELIQATCREVNAILIVASHDPALEPLFDRIFSLSSGKLVEKQIETSAV